MAKKSGFNLNPGADATLVAAATKAAMANVPKDLSKTFDTMAKNYGATMDSIGKAFKGAAQNLGKLGGQLAKKTINNIALEDEYEGTEIILDKPIEIEEDKEINVTNEASYKFDGGNKPPEISQPKTYEITDFDKPESERQKEMLSTRENVTKTTPQPKTTTVGAELRSIRKELSSLFLKTDPESRKRKRELRATRDKYFQEMELLKKGNDANNALIASENVDLEATGGFNLALNLAIKEYKNKDGKITEGDYKGYSAALSRDGNGNLSWILKNAKGEVITGKDDDLNPISTPGGKPLKVPISEMSNTLTSRIDQKSIDNVVGKDIFDKQMVFGSKKNTVYLGDQLVNKFDPLLQKENIRQQLASVRLGQDTKSLREHFNSPSEYSAEIFAGLNSATLKDMGVTDADGDGFIGDDPNTEKVETGDFVGDNIPGNAANYKRVRNAIFDRDNDNYNNGEHLRVALEKHIRNVGQISFDAGKNILTGGVTEEDRINLQKQNQQNKLNLELQNFQKNFPGGLEKFDEINTGNTVVNTPSEGKGKTVSNRVLSDMTLGLMRRADIPSNSPKGGKYKWNQQDNMYYYHRTGQTPQPIKDKNTFYTNEFGSDYNAQNLMPFDQSIKDWSGDPSKTGELEAGNAPAGYAGYTVDNNKSVPNMLGGNYYKEDKVREYFKLTKKWTGGQSYDDAYVVKKLNSGKIDGKVLSKYFTFSAVGSVNTIRATVKKDYKEFFGDEQSKDFVMDGSSFIKPLSEWMSGKMKTYAENKIKAGDYKIKDDIVGQIYTKKVTEKMAKDFPALKNDIGKTITYEYLGTGKNGGFKLLEVQE